MSDGGFADNVAWSSTVLANLQVNARWFVSEGRAAAYVHTCHHR
jgi:hypothetical protein